MADSLLIDRAPLASGSVETWTLNDPASRNALSEAMVDGLIAACEQAAADFDLRGVVLRGAGGHFCAGGSLGGFAKTIGRRDHVRKAFVTLMPGQELNLGGESV